MAKKPNIIYVLGDDQRGELLGCMGHPLLKTPQLDQLAAEGTLFTNARCTSPLCMPSRVCHYTGQWERAHGVNFNSQSALSPEAWEKTFPGLLKKAGYWTAWIGKNHVPVDLAGTSYMEDWFDCWWGNHNHSGFYPKELPNGRGDLYAAATADTQAEVFAEGALNVIKPDDAFIKRCSTHFPKRPDDQPFCLCVTFNLPHGASTSTMQLRPSDDELYKSGYRDTINDIDLPASYEAWQGADYKLPLEVWDHVWIADYDYVKRPHDLRERIVRQYQVITGIDRFIGKLRQALTETGEADNTIIVFSTDHGLLFGEHGLGGKALLYEPALHIPLIVYDPRPHAARGQRSDALVAVPDLAPTMLDLCDEPIPDFMQGVSLKPLLQNKPQHIRDELFIENLFDAQNYPRCDGIIHENYKYIRYFPRSEDPQQTGKRLRTTLDDYTTCRASMSQDEQPIYEELYNQKNDPHEQQNLVDHQEYRVILNDLRQRCQQQAASLHQIPSSTVPR